MKYAIALLLSWSFQISFGQHQIELFGGLNQNISFSKTYHTKISNGPNPAWNFSLGFALDSLRLNRKNKITTRLTIQLDKLSSTFEAVESYLGGGYSTMATVDKTMLSFGIYPLNFRIAKKLELNLGCVFSALLHERFAGEGHFLLINQSNDVFRLEEKYQRYSAALTVGLQGRLAYRIHLSPTLSLIPQYNYYYGLTGEYSEFPRDAMAMRHFILIGIKKSIL